MLGPVLLIVGLLIAAAALAVAGVYLLVGIGWSLIAGGVLMAAFALFLRSGLTPNG